MRRLDPKSVWLFFLQSVIGFLSFVIFMTLCFGVPVLIGFVSNTDSAVVITPMLLMLCGFIVLVTIPIVIISYAYAHFMYKNYKFELKAEGFYKESGVITKRYVTIPYERIQNVDINRGIIARFLGLSDLQIQTAGMSVGYGNNAAYGIASEGRLPGLSESDANQIRDELIKRAKGSKSADSGV